jgi:hypothetical protein
MLVILSGVSQITLVILTLSLSKGRTPAFAFVLVFVSVLGIKRRALAVRKARETQRCFRSLGLSAGL